MLQKACFSFPDARTTDHVIFFMGGPLCYCDAFSTINLLLTFLEMDFPSSGFTFPTSEVNLPIHIDILVGISPHPPTHNL